MSLLLVLSLFLTLAVGSFTPGNQAAASPNVAPTTPLGGANEQVASSATTARNSVHVWTREEMLNAKPYPIPSSDATPQQPQSVPSSNGPLTSAPGGAATNPNVKALKAITDPFHGLDGMQPDDYSYPFPYYRSEIYADYTSYPYSTIGKVFFTDPSNGGNYVCSASSAGNHAVWTAGHCVYNNSTSRWMTNWVFVPAYKDGNAPLGQWYASQLWTLNGWQGGNYGYDIGMALLYNNNYGYSISQWVGWLGYMANYSRNQYFTALGYPQAAPFNGNRMIACWAPHATDDPYTNPARMAIGCDMTGGSSGGPWVVGFGGGNYVNSVNTWKYYSQPNAMYGPYFGDGAINLYNSVIWR